MENHKNSVKISEITIKEEYIKLSSFLKFCGAAQTGGRASELIKSGEVNVNGEICGQKGKKLFPGDEISCKAGTFKVCKA